MNAQTWSDKAYADSLTALGPYPKQVAELGRSASRAEARRALGLCPIEAEFWIRLGTGLDMQRRWLEGGDCYVRALQLCPARGRTSGITKRTT